jgi:calcium-dependent protein kinase
LTGPIWSRVSHEGIDLVKKMLAFDPEKRISAASAISHNWILKNTETIVIEEVFNSEALKNLKDFRAENKL